MVSLQAREFEVKEKERRLRIDAEIKALRLAFRKLELEEDFGDESPSAGSGSGRGSGGGRGTGTSGLAALPGLPQPARVMRNRKIPFQPQRIKSASGDVYAARNPIVSVATRAGVAPAAFVQVRESATMRVLSSSFFGWC